MDATSIPLREIARPRVSPVSPAKVQDLQRSMFVPLSKIPKPPPAPVFISPAESKCNERERKRQKRSDKAKHRVAVILEEYDEETNKWANMRRARRMASVRGVGIAKVMKSAVERPSSTGRWADVESPQKLHGNKLSLIPGPISIPKHPHIHPKLHPYRPLTPNEEQKLQQESFPVSERPPSVLADGRRPQPRPSLRAKRRPSKDTPSGSVQSPPRQDGHPMDRPLPLRNYEETPTGQRQRRRPNLKEIVIAHNIPLTRHSTLSPDAPDTPSFPKLHKRPTLRDIIHTMEAQRSEELPPVPPIGEARPLSRQSSCGSIVSSIVDSYAMTPSPGNAFGPDGFWAGQYRRTYSIESIHKRFSISSDPSSEERSFSTNDFLKSMGRRLTVHLNQAHPFPDFEIPDDPIMKLAYWQVRSTLIEYFFSNGALQNDTPSHNIGASTTSLLHSSPMGPPPGGSSRPSLRSKRSMFRMFSGNTSTLAVDGPGLSVIKLKLDTTVTPSRKPIPFNWQKEEEKEDKWKTLDINDTSGRVLEITRAIFWQLQHEFGKSNYPTFTAYLTKAPKRIYSVIEDLDQDEEVAITQYTIRSRAQLQKTSSWQYIKDPKRHSDPAYQEDATKYEFDTILDQQRQSLKMTHMRRKSKELEIPAAGYRLLWASKFVEWAEEHHENVLLGLIEEHEQVNTEIKPSEPEEATYEVEKEDEGPIDPELSKFKFTSSSDDEDYDGSDDSEDSLTYVNVLKELQEEDNESEEPLSPLPTSPTNMLFESPDDAKKRRRRTAFNMGLRRANAEEEDKADWEETLRMGVEREKERQRVVSERKVSGWRLKKSESDD